MFATPLFASAGQEVTGHIYMKANERFVLYIFWGALIIRPVLLAL